jgi:hypothetical protein
VRSYALPLPSVLHHHAMKRRLPVYLLIDCSEFTAGLQLHLNPEDRPLRVGADGMFSINQMP